MNWVFEAYSNVYNTAMMQDSAVPVRAAVAKTAGPVTRLLSFLSHRA